MSLIAVNELTQGMVLKEDVVALDDRLLLAKGQTIGPKQLKILKIWGVSQVRVVGENHQRPAEDPQIDTAKAVLVKATVDFIFKNLDGRHDTIQEIYRTAFLHRYRDNAPILRRSGAQAADASHGCAKIDAIHERIQNIEIKLPEAPAIIADLNTVTSDAWSTSNDIAQVIQKSPSLTSLLLRIVNSAVYGFSSRIDSISRAVTIIGTKEISCLAIGICVMREFKDIPADIIDMPSFIRHSYACGLISRILAAHLNMPQTEQMFVSGLLHDIGKLIIFKYFTKHAKEIIALASCAGDSVYHLEKSVLGRHHTQIGSDLVKKWKLPSDLQDAIISHHSPQRAANPRSAVLVQMADLIANAMGIGNSGEQTLTGFDLQLWGQVGIANSLLPMIIRQALHQLDAMEANLKSS